MKNQVLKTGAFALAFIVVIITGAKPGAYAQEKKEVKKTIVITNSDTIINGRNLKQVSRAERKKLLKDLDAKKRVEVQAFDKGPGNMQVIIRKQKDGEPEEVIVKNLGGKRAFVWKDGEMQSFGPNAPLPPQFKLEMDTLMFKMYGDSAFKQMRIRMKNLDTLMQKHFNAAADLEFFVHPPDAPRAPMSPKVRIMGRGMFENEKNAQSFSYSNVDKDGISNNLNIRLGEAAKDALTKITGSTTAKTDLNVQDLNIFPSFSVGKLNLAFSLKTKGALEVKLLDRDLNSVFTDKPGAFNETYYKAIDMPKNGIYYIAVMQNGNWFVKKMIKE